MPELPEVETIARSLRRTPNLSSTSCLGTIVGMKFSQKRLRDPIPYKALEKILCETPILKIFRRAKYLLLGTERGYALFHFGMSGRLRVVSSHDPMEAHTHARFQVQRSSQIMEEWRYVDPRRFGRISAHLGPHWQTHPYLEQLGPEPLDHPNLGQHLYQHRSLRPIKALLLDGRVVAGLGNIYVCEALHQAKIHPAQPSHAVSLKRYKILARAIEQILHAAILACGTTLRDYRDSQGKQGLFSSQLLVYAQKTCSFCSSTIANLRMSSRSSWYCPRCQHL